MLRSYNIAWHKFCSLSLNIVKEGSGEKQKIVQIKSFPIIFVTVCNYCWQKVKLAFFGLSVSSK